MMWKEEDQRHTIEKSVRVVPKEKVAEERWSCCLPSFVQNEIQQTQQSIGMSFLVSSQI